METTAVNKIRAIAAWADYQSEYFNEQFKSVADMERVYDYCQHTGVEFADDLIEPHTSEINKILGYKIY